VNDAIVRIAAMSSPSLLWVGFNAPHAPLHTPPAALHNTTPRGRRARYSATVTALDTEIGRLLEHVDLATTTVIFVGDNGTPGPVARPPLTRNTAKETLYEGGVHVPLIIAGPLVKTPGTSHAMVHTVDLFATIVDIAGVDLANLPRPVDGISLVPLLRDPSGPGDRQYVFAERFRPNGLAPDIHRYMIRDHDFKLIRTPKAPEAIADELYDMRRASVEGANLLYEPLTGEAKSAYGRLRRASDDLVAGGSLPGRSGRQSWPWIVGLLLAGLAGIFLRARKHLPRRTALGHEGLRAQDAGLAQQPHPE
jgi:arylsulfatase A-like enzyme